MLFWPNLSYFCTFVSEHMDGWMDGWPDRRTSVRMKGWRRMAQLSTLTVSDTTTVTLCSAPKTASVVAITKWANALTDGSWSVMRVIFVYPLLCCHYFNDDSFCLVGRITRKGQFTANKLSIQLTTYYPHRNLSHNYFRPVTDPSLRIVEVPDSSAFYEDFVGFLIKAGERELRHKMWVYFLTGKKLC